jgi:hypothetical protein
VVIVIAATRDKDFRDVFIFGAFSLQEA